MEIQYNTLFNIVQQNIHHPMVLQKIKTNYLLLLSHLTQTEPLTLEHFLQQVNQIHAIGTIQIAYLEYTEYPQYLDIIGSGTLIVEPKLIRGGKPVGHIEDIVVHPQHRGKGIATQILTQLTQYAETKECYKVILDCKEEVAKVYEKAGFEKHGLQMSKYF